MNNENKKDLSKNLSFSDMLKEYEKMSTNGVYIDLSFIKMTGSIKAAFFLSQVLYWTKIMMKKYGKEKFYKTDEDWIQEIFFTIKEIKNIRKILVELEYITVKREGEKGRNTYTVNIEKIIKDKLLLKDGIKEEKQIDNVDSPKETVSDEIVPNVTSETPSDSTKGTNQIVPNVPSLFIHKTTLHEITSPSPNITRLPREEDTENLVGEGKKIFKEENSLGMPVIPEIISPQRDENKNIISSPSPFPSNSFTEQELEKMASILRNIWPDYPNKARSGLICISLKDTLTKISFDDLCKYAKSYVQRKQGVHLLGPHKWLLDECWRSEISSYSISNSIHEEALKKKELIKLMMEKSIHDSLTYCKLEKEIRLRLLKMFGEGDYKKYLDSSVIQFQDDMIIINTSNRYDAKCICSTIESPIHRKTHIETIKYRLSILFENNPFTRLLILDTPILSKEMIDLLKDSKSDVMQKFEKMYAFPKEFSSHAKEKEILCKVA